MCPQVPEEVKDFFRVSKGEEKDKSGDVECFDVEEDMVVNSKRKGTMDPYVTEGKKKQLTLNEMAKEGSPSLEIFVVSSIRTL